MYFLIPNPRMAICAERHGIQQSGQFLLEKSTGQDKRKTKEETQFLNTEMQFFKYFL